MKYYCAITNRDAIKIEGERRPFWEFLDQHPDGWLCSLAYQREDLPQDRHRIWDCGAWSYNAIEIPNPENHLVDESWLEGRYRELASEGAYLDLPPKLNGSEVTPEWALEQYRQLAQPGDFVIAPDHMIIHQIRMSARVRERFENDGTVRTRTKRVEARIAPLVEHLDARRAFNSSSAEEFLQRIREERFRGLVPMATVHGDTIEERIEMGRRLREMGYEHIALGGLAGQAGSIAHCKRIVGIMRDELPDVWLHVLGLTSPQYTREWAALGVDSFDGSSHFKQAFTGKKFYVANGVDLDRYLAVPPGERSEAPLCDCVACTRLRDEDIDTREYGSNENNMGRAAHNLNQYLIVLENIRRAETEVLRPSEQFSLL